MFKLLCVTNRRLCREDFLSHLEKILREGPEGVILREKDLSLEEYELLAVQVLTLCTNYRVPCILHCFPEVAVNLKHKAIHLPMSILRSLTWEERGSFEILGASCHSVEESREAESLGCTYVTAGHIFRTDCKRGLPGRGVEFLRQVCQAVSIPVYAIGGVEAGRLQALHEAGAAGACLMSSLMCTEDFGILRRSSCSYYNDSLCKSITFQDEVKRLDKTNQIQSVQ